MKKVNFAPRHFDAEMLFRDAFGRGGNYTVFIFSGFLRVRKEGKGKYFRQWFKTFTEYGTKIISSKV